MGKVAYLFHVLYLLALFSCPLLFCLDAYLLHRPDFPSKQSGTLFLSPTRLDVSALRSVYLPRMIFHSLHAVTDSVHLLISFFPSLLDSFIFLQALFSLPIFHTVTAQDLCADPLSLLRVGVVPFSGTKTGEFAGVVSCLFPPVKKRAKKVMMPSAYFAHNRTSMVWTL